MRIQVIQHVPFEDAGAIAHWALRAGHDANAMLALTEQFPAAGDYDMLVIMGGPMGVGDEAAHPWLVREKHVIAEAIEAGRIVLGVCLGAQLVAHVLGAGVTRNPEPEIGWFEVRKTPEARDLPLLGGWPESFTALHWHGDTFGIPDGAVRLAESDACANQGFLYGERVAGLQFHLETGADGLERLIEACGDELVEGPWVRSAQDLWDGLPHAAAAHELLHAMLDRLEETGVAR